MSPDELRQLKETLKETITDQHHSAEALIEESFRQHLASDQHRFVEAEMLKQKRKTEQWEKYQGNIFFAIAVTGTSAVGFWIWDNFKAIMKYIFA